jgi:hypothetical protein
MARSAARAEAEDTIANPGNREPNYTAVSITVTPHEPQTWRRGVYILGMRSKRGMTEGGRS